MRSNKGAVTLYVIIAMLTISAFLMAIYIRNTNAEKAQIEITEKIKSTYENYDSNEVYETLKNNKSAIIGYSITNDILTIETPKSNNVNVDQNGKRIVYFAVTTTNAEPIEVGQDIGKWQNSNVINISSIEVRESIYLWTKNEDDVVSYSYILDTIELYKIYGDSVEQETTDSASTVEVASVGDKSKNLIDYKTFLSRDQNSYPLTVNDDGSLDYNGNYYIKADISHLESGKTYIFNMEYTFDGELITDNIAAYHIYYDDGTLTASRYGSAITTDSTKKITELYCYFKSGYTSIFTAKIWNIQLIEGNTPTEYEPYGKYKIPITTTGKNEETITKVIYLDEPLRKVDEQADYIDFKAGKIVRKIGKTVIEGYETWSNYYVLTTPKEETIDLPEIPTFSNINNISIETTVKPSNLEMHYK